MRIKLKYVDAFLNRKTGRTYAFFRRRGQRIALPGLIGSPEFMAGYHACLRGEPPAQAVAETTARTGPGTINAAVAQYLESGTFAQLGEATASGASRHCESSARSSATCRSRRSIANTLSGRWPTCRRLSSRGLGC
jgi:hypothetical protein